MESVDELLDAARSETGLDDFGNDSFREGLERLVRSLQEESDLNELGAFVLRMRIVGALKNRLHVEDWYRRHPEIDDEVITAPLFGLGLPRTGSTALSFLLAEDPNTRSLATWESGEPCPPPSTGINAAERIAQTEMNLAAQDAITPRLQYLLPSSATGPMECLELMGLEFKTQIYNPMASIPSYARWLDDADMRPAYEYEKRVLKLLQWGEPTRPWRLKTPVHLLYLDALDEVFPDARFVMTHRDPTQVVVSVSDLFSEFRTMMNTTVDLHEIGADNVAEWSLAMERAIAFRDKPGNDERFYDMDFRAMQRDPIGEVRKLYAWLGEPVTPEFEAGMRAWWQEHSENRERNEHPEPATFGLDLDAVRPRFADYLKRMETWTGATA
ncbi:MAG TPA: sulfotransferase [Mycobacteriales bacterium]|nr:sulfotransferase [Mycobacteriales bacterium]